MPLTNTVALALKSATTNVDVSAATAPSSGQVLTATGTTAATWQTPSGGSTTPTMKLNSNFYERGTAGGAGTLYVADVINGSASASGVDPTDGGVYMRTSATAGGSVSFVRNIAVGTTNVNIFSGNPIFYSRVQFFSGATGAGSFFCGLGAVTVAGTGHTFTTDHIGFKIVKVASVVSVYGTTAVSATESATSALTTLAAGDLIEMILVATSNTNVAFYYRKNGGTLSSATNITTNIPATDKRTIQHSISNDNDNNQYWMYLHGWGYER